jgi:hypothetical protein
MTNEEWPMSKPATTGHLRPRAGGLLGAVSFPLQGAGLFDPEVEVLAGAGSAEISLRD